MNRLIYFSKLFLNAGFAPVRGIFGAMDLRKHSLNRLTQERPGSQEREVWVFGAVEDYSFIVRYYFYLRAFLVRGASPRVIWLNTAIRFRADDIRLKITFIKFVTRNPWALSYWRFIYHKLYRGDWETFFNLLSHGSHEDESRRIFETLGSRQQLVNLTHRGILIGDLIYDTYLRFKPAETVKLDDPFLLELIEKSLILIENITDFLIRKKATRVINSYTSYIHHGILVRIALKMNIVVHTLGLFQQLINRPTLDFPFHKRNFWSYRKWFKALPHQEEALRVGRRLLEKRLNGDIDQATSYMKESAYNSGSGLKIVSGPPLDDRPKVLLMGHDFYDSPHIYGEMAFADFMDWTLFCLEAAKKSPYQLLVKPHPNSMPESRLVWDRLKLQYPHVTFLDLKTSNLEILKLNIKFALTVYGTVAHEFAFRNVRVLTCADNPHSIYTFNHQVKSVEQLRAYLYGEIEPNFTISQEELCEFAYVHNFRILNNHGQIYPWSLSARDFKREIQTDPEERTAQMWKAIQDVDLI